MANRFPLIVDSVNLNIKELPSGDNLDLTGSDALFGDNDKAIFGAGSDLQIYHDGSNSIISESGTGSLILRGTNTSIQDSSSVNMIQALSGGAVTLYHNSAPKLATTSTGIDVTGVVEATGYLAVEGTSGNTGVGTDRWIGGDGTAGTWFYNVPTGSNHYFAVNNTNKLAINSTGIDVTGTVTADGLTVDSNSTTGAVKIQSGDTNTFGGGRAQIAFGYNATDDYQHFVRTAHDVNASGNKLELLLSDGTQNNTITSGSNRVISFAGNGDISFYNSAGNSQNFYWDASTSRLGLGTTAPSTTLDVTGTVTADGLTSSGNIFINASSGNPDLTIKTAGAGNNPHINYRAGDNVVFDNMLVASAATDYWRVGYGASGTVTDEHLVVTSAGNVGIGTTSPSSILDINTTGAGVNIQAGNAAADIALGIGSPSTANKVVVTAGGNVGIGTDTPNVHGWTKALSIDGGTSSSSAVELNQNGTKVGALSLQGDQRLQVVNHTANPITFHTNGIVNERMRIDSAGNVGIGTSAPVEPLHVREANDGGTARVALFENAATLAGSQAEILLVSGGNTDRGVAVSSYNESASGQPASMIFSTSAAYAAPTERMRIDSNGNVGIGTSSPDNKLHVYKGANGHSWSFDAGDAFIVENSDSVSINLATPSANSANILFSDADARGQGRIVYDHSSDYMGFHTAGVGNERMRIDSSGNVGIGRTPVAYGSFKVLDLAGSSGAIQKLIHTGSTVELQSYASATVGAVGTATSHPLLFTTGDTERMRIDANGNVIVGGISDGAAGSVTLQGDGDIKGVLSSGTGGDTILSAIYGVSNGYQISVTTGNAQTYKWHNGGAQSMTLNASGNLLVGTTTGSGTTGTYSGFGAYAGGNIFSSSVGRSIFARRSTDGDIIEFRKDGTTVGSIGSRSGAVSYIVLDPRSGLKGAALIGGSIDANEGIINPGRNDGDIADAAISFGTSSSRFKDLYLSGGVYLGGTGSANKLDDYEEGTFTPVVAGSTTAGTFTYNTQEGKYTKVGNLVHINIAIYVTATSTSPVGTMTINGLPFTTSAQFPSFSIGWTQYITFAGQIGAYGGGTQITLRSLLSGGSGANIQGSNFGSAFYIFIAGTYEVA